MAVYSIKDLEQLSGIKAHTIRIWEKRYELIQPNRTQTNIRYYNDDDLRFLLNVGLLNRNGIKISKIAKMTEDEISRKVADISEVNSEHATQLDALTISMIEMDEYKFNRIVSTNIKQIGLEKTMVDVINPFLSKLTLLWLTGSINPAQVHFITCLIRQKIIVAIDAVPLCQAADKQTFLLYLPEGEIQELVLLFVHYLLKIRQQKVIYLGQNIPLDDLQTAYKIHQPEYVYTILSPSFNKVPLSTYINHLSTGFPDSKILLSGYEATPTDAEASTNIHFLDSLPDTITFFDNLAITYSKPPDTFPSNPRHLRPN